MQQNNQNLHDIAKQVMTPCKGILASDERPSSANKNLTKAGILVPQTPDEQFELRRRYREIFINTPELGVYISGMILHDETFWQNDSTNKPFRQILQEKNVLLIIKVDEGTTALPGFAGEEITLGLDNLSPRLKKYYENGARLAKWRAVVKISDTLPTIESIQANATALAEYSLMCQESGIVPIVEPEVLIDGDHSIQKSEEVTELTLKIVFEYLNKYKVDLKGIILKSSMVISGKEALQKATSEQVAEATVRVLKNTVPSEVPGVVFLSGGQTSEEASLHLNAIAKFEPLPWQIAFSYLRAIEGPAAIAWQGKDENVDIAREAFIKQLKQNVLADQALL